jgi:hypothetical protein
VYTHIDIKLHPLLVQLDGTMIAALMSFFKVRESGFQDDVEHRKLDKVMGVSVIARAGARGACDAVCSGRGASERDALLLTL